MKIVKFPPDYTFEDLQYLANKLKEGQPDEYFIFIRNDITYIDLSLKELYEMKELVEKAIREKENK